MWVDMTDKIISNRTIRWKGKQLHLPAAIEEVNTVSFNEKQKLWNLITAELTQISEVAEHEFNAIVTDAHTEGERRGYQKPYSATVIGYEDTEASLESLVSVVSERGFPLSQAFYKAKAKLHNVDTLHYAERSATIASDLSIDIDEAITICRNVFYGLKSEYGELFDTMLKQGQIDIYPRPGKQGGAFMSAQTGHPIMALLNHTNTFSALETLAHEMGHAIHAHRSSTQSSFYDGHSIITAETASTLFENLVFDAVYAQAHPVLQQQLLHDRLIRDISTIQRQIAFFNTELAIHNHIITKGAITKETLRDITATELKAYLGKSVTLTHADGYTYVYVSHLRYGFYVYSYTFGLLMSSIMSERYKQDNRYIEQIDLFLRAGASASVADIFKQIGIDTTKPDTFIEALHAHKQNVNAFIQSVKTI
jgi:oligoendopeptidase F